MLRNPSATPCPIPPQRPQQHGRASFLSPGDDTTSNIDFTAAFGGSLRNTRPRRRQNVVATARDRNTLGFQIHEDAELLPNGARKKPALAQPAKRAIETRPTHAPAHDVSFALRDENQEECLPQVPDNSNRRFSQTQTRYAPRQADISSRLGGPRRPAIKPERPLVSLPENSSIMLTSTPVLKPPRRGTIYIPNEDTTMPSMYMGIFSPIKDINAGLVSGPEEAEMEITDIAAQMAKKRMARRSMMATSPKRAPLHLLQKNIQESATVDDRVGQGGGKENVPPGHSAAGDKIFGRHVLTSNKQPFDDELRYGNAHINDNREKKVLSLHEPPASSTGRIVEKKSSQNASIKPTWNSGPRTRTSHPIELKKTISKSNENAKAQDQVRLKKPTVPTRFVVPSVKTELLTEAYPILTEDLTAPSMYEDNWLSYQEISITQLVNNLFGASCAKSSSLEDGMLRIRLVEKYGEPGNVMLYKRLQAALLFGALSVPTDILKGAGQWSSDIGRRKAFTNLWLETYDLHCLQSALEVVVGRQCRVSPARRSSVNGAIREALQRFIDTFLIRNEDGCPEQQGTDRAAWSYQRTILRSLMLIKVLDITKTTASQLVSGCLFQSSSSHKNSVCVVKALFQQLNPSAGDPIRALSHIGYRVTHSQYPLEEYENRIQNLAVDLRDGVRLTRLVELLLYPSASRSLDYTHDPNSTTTVLLPTGESLSLTEGEADWPLSQHLKLPCIGRATKLYNVQIALSALQDVRGMAAVVQDVKAEDVVDGYREKTVKLLWGLTSKWGLGGLVDWDDVEREIKRLCRTASNNNKKNSHIDFYDALHDEEDGPVRYHMLLKSWAQAIASKNGLAVTNLTTSFADKQVFEAIVDEYEGFFVNSADAVSSMRRRPPLGERLRGLGCSEQFAGLFAGSGTTADTSRQCGHVVIFDRDFVVAALAFLCSRLLGPTKGSRAAVTIQRAWRRHWAQVLKARKCRLKMMAEGCAEAARTRRRRQVGLEDVVEPDDECEMNRDTRQRTELAKSNGEGNIPQESAPPFCPSDDQHSDNTRPGSANDDQIKIESDTTLKHDPQEAVADVDADDEDIWLCL